MSSFFVGCLARKKNLALCSCSGDFNIFPTRSVGGPPGAYKMQLPLSSKDYGEFCVVAVSNLGTNASSILITGAELSSLAALDSTGNTTYDDQSYVKGINFVCGGNSTLTPNETWERISNAQGYIFIRITSGTFVTVSIKFREKIMKVVPGPMRTVHPEDMEQMNYLRERRIQRSVLGNEGEIEEYGRRPGKPGRIATW